MISLLAPAFAVMSLASFAALPFLIGPDMPPLRAYAAPAMLCILFCLLGHAGLFFMLKSVDASRASPLLAIKVPMLALFYFAVCGESYTAWQWLGVALVAPAAWLLCKAGRAIPAKAMLWLLFGCAAYGGSDYCIQIALGIFKDCGSTLRSSMLAFFVVYAAGGVYGAAGLLCGLVPTRREFTRCVLPFSFFWLLAIAVLFVCFAMIGVVGGNIVQSTRGLISVFIGWLLARNGFEHLEEKVPRSVFMKRVVSAVLVILAVLLFNIGKDV